MSDTLRDALPGLTDQEIADGWEARNSTNNPYCATLTSWKKAVRWAEGQHRARAALAAAEQLAAPDMESRAMFVSRLENMQQQGDKWLTIVAVLALLDDCDMLANYAAADRATPGPAQPGAAAMWCETVSRFMRIVDAYAFDYAKDGKLAPSRGSVERVFTKVAQAAVPQPSGPVATLINMTEGTEYPPAWHSLTNAEALPSFKRYYLYATPQPDASAGAQRETDSERVLRLMASGWLVAHNESWSALTDEANTATAWFCERTAAPFCTSRYESVRRWTGPTPIAALDASIADLGAEFPKIAKLAAPTPATPGETK